MIDLISEPEPKERRDDAAGGTNDANDTSGKHPVRKFVGIKFNCCGIYVRIYVNKDGTAYEGHCPRCFKPVKLKIGSGGTSSRFFEAY